MLSKTQIKILSVFRNNLFTKLTFKEIKTLSKQKSNSMVQTAIALFKEKNLLNIESVGDINLYSLNLSNRLTKTYLSLCLEEDTKKISVHTREVINETIKHILERTEFFILSLFGSHVKGKATTNSDIDMMLIADDESARSKIKPIIETIRRRELSKIDCHIFTKEEFTEMIENNSENLGKQIYRSSLVFYGLEQYIELLRNIYDKPSRTLLSKSRK